MPIYIIWLPLAVLPVFCLSAWIDPAAMCLWSAVFLYTFRSAADHWPCFGAFTWGIVGGWFFAFLPLWRLTVYSHTLDVKRKAWNLNPLLPPFRFCSHRSLTDTSEHRRKQSCQQLEDYNKYCLYCFFVGLWFWIVLYLVLFFFT